MAVLPAFAPVTTGYKLGFWIRRNNLNICLSGAKKKYTNCVSLKQGLLFFREKAANRVTKETTCPKVQKQAYFSIYKLQM